MEGERQTIIAYHLILNELEAQWLRGLIQNPLVVDNPDDESEFDRDMRDGLWQALKEA